VSSGIRAGGSDFRSPRRVILLAALVAAAAAVLGRPLPAAADCTPEELASRNPQRCAQRRGAALRACVNHGTPFAACDLSKSKPNCGALSTTCTPAHDLDEIAVIVYGAAPSSDRCLKRIFTQATQLVTRKLALVKSGHPERLPLATNGCASRGAAACATTPALAPPCAASTTPFEAASCVCERPPDWTIALSTSAPAGQLSPALLGQYDLSGALFHYDQVPGLASAMAGAGFGEWRIGLGRWESGTLLLPSLTNGTPCSFPIPEAFAPPGTTDLDLIAARDWFTDDGLPVTLPATLADDRYALGYLRSAIDVATAFGAAPYVSIDHMPRALAVNRTPLRTDCSWSGMNRVSNVRPTDAIVFASAVTGMVRRIVEGSGAEPGRPVTHWEFWNEPELPFFWDPVLGNGIDGYLQTAAPVLVALRDYRAGSSNPAVAAQRFGFGSFAMATTAAAAIQAFDGLTIPGVGTLPFDFVSFHSYDDDPLVVADDVALVAAAAAASQHYANVELVLAEWGPSLDHMADAAYASSMDPPLLAATVIALGAASGLDRAHHSIVWGFYDPIVGGLLDRAVEPLPIYGAYMLLHSLIGSGAARLAPIGHEDGRLDGGLGAVLAGRDPGGAIRVLLVNRADVPRTVRIETDGVARIPVATTVFDDPALPPRDVPAPWPSFVIPARSVALVDVGAN